MKIKKGILPNEKLLITPSPEKYWKELGPLEKLERMRKIIKNTVNSRDIEISFLRRKVDELMQHKHNLGIIVIPMKTDFTMGVGEGGSKRLGEKDNDEVYF